MAELKRGECDEKNLAVWVGAFFKPLPGPGVVCGDSHTATHGAVGALAFGIGTSEVEHVLATQTIQQNKSKTMLINVEGKLQKGVTPKDVILYIIYPRGLEDGFYGCYGEVFETRIE